MAKMPSASRGAAGLMGLGMRRAPLVASHRLMLCFHVHTAMAYVQHHWTTDAVLPILCGMDTNRAATSLEALGSPTRLEIFRLLVRAGPTGAVVGELQTHLNIPAST